MLGKMPLTGWIANTWSQIGCGGRIGLALGVILLSPFYFMWLPFDLLIGAFRSGLIGKRLDAETPPTDLDGFPFGNRPYAVKRERRDNGKPDKVEYLADSGALANVIRDVESVMRGQYGNEFRNTLRLMRPVDSPYPRKAPEDNYAYMELKPPLKSGKPAKFPVLVGFSATTATERKPIADSRVGGTLKYATNGSVGSADITTGHGFEYESARYRIVKGKLMLTKLVRYTGGQAITIYER